MRISIALSALLVASACSGQLFVRDTRCTSTADCADEQRCVSGKCVPPDQAACTPANTGGSCPSGSTCQCGVCTTTAYDCCNCRADQGCENGSCKDIIIDTHCSKTVPQGLCAAAEVCVEGCCVPITESNMCSDTKKRGLCPPGAACLDGICTLIAGRPCTVQDPTGLCPAGERCGPPCAAVACSADEPAGSCSCVGGDDGACADGSCKPLPCSLEHLTGYCLSQDEKCSAAGVCIPKDKCMLDGDCTAYGNAFCSCAAPGAPGTCIGVGVCACDSDCNEGLGEVCNTATSVCERGGLCGGDDECLTDEYCGSAGRCLKTGTCETTADCVLVNPAQFCSVIKTCLDVATCGADGDCLPNVEFCGCKDAAARPCVATGACACDSDCPPGDACNNGACEVTGTSCTANGPTTCVGSVYWCCPTGESCCPQGQRCSLGAGTPGHCIPDGTCIDDLDCPTDFTCVDYACVPTNACAAETCAPGFKCSAAGGCVDVNACVVDGDCLAGEVCNALFQCEPKTGCGNQEFQTTLVPPNMLVVIDRSGSMNACIGTESRWDIMRTALTTVATDNNDKIRFGLSTFPRYCNGSTECAVGVCGDSGNCTNSCAWGCFCEGITDQPTCDATYPCGWISGRCAVGPPNDDLGVACTVVCSDYDGRPGNCDRAGCAWTDPSCVNCSTYNGNRSACVAHGGCSWRTSNSTCRAAPDSNNAMPGDVDVPVGDNHAAAVIAALAPPSSPPGPQHPGGYTPTGRTLRNIAGHLSGFGLPDPADPTPRSNYVLLMSDGEANSDGGTYGVCDTVPGTYVERNDTIWRVDCALDALRGSTPSVGTFVVGFGDVALPDGNCFAVHGGTSRCATPAMCQAATNSADCGALLGCTWNATTCGGGVDDSNCNDDPPLATCFYNAQSASDLTTAFADIAGRVAGCSYAIDFNPLLHDPDLIFVYLDYQAGGNPQRIVKDPSHVSNWDFDVVSSQVTIYGAQCDAVKGGGAVPIVILGCSTTGG